MRPVYDVRKPPDTTNWVEKDGFMYAYDTLFAKTYNPDTEDSFYIERLAPDVLRRMFFPNLSEEGKEKIYRYKDDSFVRAQLKHYGVEYDESEITRKGAVLMRKAIAAGKFQDVPAHLKQFERNMLYDYIQTCQPIHLDDNPDWVMMRYWLDAAGRVDREKTKRVAKTRMSGPTNIADDLDDNMSLLSLALNNIDGLHRAIVLLEPYKSYDSYDYERPRAYYFMGWDAEAVAKSAERYYMRCAALKEFNHPGWDYLEDTFYGDKNKPFMPDLPRLPTNLPNPGNAAKLILKKRSPIGHYVVSCPRLEEHWPETKDQLNLDVFATEVDGLYEVRFDFGRAVGAMIFSMNQEDLECYFDELDYNTCSPTAPIASHDAKTVNPDPSAGTSAGSYVYKFDFTREVHEHAKKLAAELAADNDVFEDSAEQATDHSQPVIFPGRIKFESNSRGGRTLLGKGVRNGNSPKAPIIEFEDKRFMQFKVTTQFSFLGPAVVDGPHGFLVFKARKISFTPSQDKDSWESFHTGYQALGPYRNGCFPQRRVIPNRADPGRPLRPSKYPVLIKPGGPPAASEDADNDENTESSGTVSGAD
ncbi:hypothetical protein F5Y18DRAFT_154372 [Xylariaceae sp. FL1019]|nr:hypothetical protein F5Y18DRAFT_154372 [Xylariaceae sp. FL1019]